MISPADAEQSRDLRELPKPDRRRLANARQASDYLGVPLNTLYDWAEAGRIAGIVRVGRRVFFDLDKVDEWIGAGGDAGGDRAEKQAA